MSIEILILAAAAIFVLFRLFSVLGKQKGAPPPAFRTPDQAERPHPVLVHSDSDDEREDESESLSGLQQIARADPTFSQKEFLVGAKMAYEMIVHAFAEGDRGKLQTLLNPDIYADYDTAISDREKNSGTAPELMRIRDASIESAAMNGSVAEISVHFEAEIGDGERISRTHELWTFERDTKNRDPNGRLSDVSED